VSDITTSQRLWAFDQRGIIPVYRGFFLSSVPTALNQLDNLLYFKEKQVVGS
jgi:hypothetical protein